MEDPLLINNNSHSCESGESKNVELNDEDFDSDSDVLQDITIDKFIASVDSDHGVHIRTLFARKNPEPTGNLNLKFDAFTREETKLSQQDSAYLVKPSGTLDAPIVLHLNYPSFQATEREFGSVADSGSACIGMIMTCGFNCKNSLWVERSWRREVPIEGRTGNPIDGYADKLRSCHLELTEWLLENSTAKVMLVFGQRNRDIYLHSGMPSFNIEMSEGELLTVALAYNNSAHERLDRILVFAVHPEHVLRHPTAARLFGEALMFAAGLVGMGEVDASWLWNLKGWPAIDDQ